MWCAGQSAGLTIAHTLETMGPRELPNVESARRWLLDGVTRGRSIADLVKAGGSRFESFETSLLTLGEETGTLEQSLRLLAEFYSRKHRLMLWVKKQMAYPFFSAFFACFIAPLQLLVMGYAGAYLVIAGGSLVALFSAGGSIIVGVSKFFGNKPRLVRARFIRSLATAIEAGLPLPRSVRLAADASANDEIRTYIRGFSERQLMERPIADTLARCPLMMPDMLAIIETAERTGDFGILSRFADLYEDGFR
jgi:type II secretory pathway component PulF